MMSKHYLNQCWSIGNKLQLNFSRNSIHLKLSSGKRQPFWLSLNELKGFQLGANILSLPWKHDDFIKWKYFLRSWPGEFPAQRPVTRSFDVSFDLHLNKRLRKQSWGWWFETPWCSLWRHCNESCKCWGVHYNPGYITGDPFIERVVMIIADYVSYRVYLSIWGLAEYKDGVLPL